MFDKLHLIPGGKDRGPKKEIAPLDVNCFIVTKKGTKHVENNVPNDDAARAVTFGKQAVAILADGASALDVGGEKVEGNGYIASNKVVDLVLPEIQKILQGGKE